MPLDRSWEAALTSPAASSPTLAAARHRRIRCGCCTITLTEPLLEHRCELTVLLTLFSLLPVPRWLTSDEGKSSPLSDVVVVVTFTRPYTNRLHHCTRLVVLVLQVFADEHFVAGVAFRHDVAVPLHPPHLTRPPRSPFCLLLPDTTSHLACLWSLRSADGLAPRRSSPWLLDEAAGVLCLPFPPRTHSHCRGTLCP